jgi:phosphoesterase RecJ-like protein
VKPWFNDSDVFQRLLESLVGKRVAVLGHIRPDGDCIGSQVAMTRVLRQQGVDAIAVNQHDVPQNCRSFLGDTPFFRYDAVDLNGYAFVSVDCADRSRLGKLVNASVDEILINVDHHISNTLYAQHNFVHPEASAAAEILSGFFIDANIPLDPVTAQALYVGMATDTGQFRFGTTTQQVFDLCAALIRCGASPAESARELYEREPITKIRLLQAFLNSLEFHCGGRVCIGSLTQKIWDETGAKKEETEGLVDYARCIEGVEIGVLIEENDGQVKGSFRAKDPIHRVDLLAQKLNGGGHACAAGFNPKMSLSNTYERVVSILTDHFSE